MKRDITNIRIVDKVLCRFMQAFLLCKYEYLLKSRKPPVIQDRDRTVQEIIENKKSISRFGDGEFELIKSHDVKFQKSSIVLSARLTEVLESDDPNLLIGIPKIFDKNDIMSQKFKDRIFWRETLARFSSEIYRHINLNKVYYDALFSRPYMGYADRSGCRRYFNEIKKIWDKRNVVLVEGIYSRAGVGNDLFDNCSSLKRILAPCENAFDKYDEILKETSKADKSYLILIALGPTATVLSYDLCKDGYQAIDIGHIDIEYEWFLKNAEEKIIIDDKYTNEVNGGDSITNFEKINDENYKKQIIRIIT